MLTSNSGPSAREWAKTANIEVPVKWGELENQIISLRLMPEKRDAGANWLLGLIMVVPVVSLLLFFSAPVIGAALVVWATRSEDASAQSNLVTLAVFMFVVSIVVSGSSLSLWWQTRTRSISSIAAGVVTVVSVAVTFAAGKSYDGDLPGSWLELLALASGLLGLVLVILNLAAKSSKREGISLTSRDERRYDAAREEVLDVLVERGVVDLTADQRHRMQRMRVGTWHKFDAQGRV